MPALLREIRDELWGVIIFYIDAIVLRKLIFAIIYH